MSIVSGLYRLARLAAWSRAYGKLLQGNSRPLARRYRNAIVYKAVGRLLK